MNELLLSLATEVSKSADQVLGPGVGATSATGRLRWRVQCRPVGSTHQLMDPQRPQRRWKTFDTGDQQTAGAVCGQRSKSVMCLMQSYGGTKRLVTKRLGYIRNVLWS